ncbi:hypothetical protein C8J56DRAFT_503042 [Mycena floridula]|nr:hypothetical protein C8J56DRAFT_503042 [Mycena floridula]
MFSLVAFLGRWSPSFTYLLGLSFVDLNALCLILAFRCLMSRERSIGSFVHLGFLISSFSFLRRPRSNLTNLVDLHPPSQTSTSNSFPRQQ